MKFNTTKILIVVVAALVVLGLGTMVVAAAEDSSSTSSYPPIIQRLADTFNLNPDDVAEVFEEERQARIEERNAQFESWLDELVEDGRLTEDQKDSIVAKREEIQSRMEEIREIDDPDERRDAMLDLQIDILTWAQENDIDPAYLKMFGGRRGFRGGPGGGGFGGPGCGGPGYGGPGGCGNCYAPPAGDTI